MKSRILIGDHQDHRANSCQPIKLHLLRDATHLNFFCQNRTVENGLKFSNLIPENARKDFRAKHNNYKTYNGLQLKYLLVVLTM